jgi:hypothetical protein
VDEVRVDVHHGYNVLEIHELYDYEVTQYDPKIRKGGSSSDIDTFLKPKARASGYAGWVQGPENEERNVQYFLKSEGIELDKTWI